MVWLGRRLVNLPIRTDDTRWSRWATGLPMATVLFLFVTAGALVGVFRVMRGFLNHSWRRAYRRSLFFRRTVGFLPRISQPGWRRGWLGASQARYAQPEREADALAVVRY